MKFFQSRFKLGSRSLALRFAQNGLVGPFTGSSPRLVALWLEKNWKPHLIGKMSHSLLLWKGFFAFLFEKKEDHDLILGVFGNHDLIGKMSHSFCGRGFLPFCLRRRKIMI
jgi:hypothetical protein